MQVRLEYVEEVAKNIRTFWFRPEKPVHFIAGQFTQIHLPLSETDSRGPKHWFTISSSPTEKLIGLTTKFFAGDGSAFKRAFKALEPGTELSLAEPMGDFVLPKDTSIPLLFVAGGIGVTPFRSIIKWLSDVHEIRDVHLLYSVRDAKELAFLDIFQNYQMKFTPIVTEPTDDWNDNTGMLTPQRILEHVGPDPRTLIYVAGPEPMVEAFVDELIAYGIPKHRLVTDYFPGYDAI